MSAEQFKHRQYATVPSKSIHGQHPERLFLLLFIPFIVIFELLLFIICSALIFINKTDAAQRIIMWVEKNIPDMEWFFK